MNEKQIYKIISLSSSSAGLTTLYSNYAKKFNSITPLESKYQIGIDFYSKEIKLPNGLMLTLHFWKLYFQARFNFFLKKLVKDATAGLLMFDIMSQNSLYNIEMYIPIFRTYNPKLPIILLGNKTDLMENRLIDEEYLEQYISRNKITSYFEISAQKDTNRKIEEIFYNLANLIINRS